MNVPSIPKRPGIPDADQITGRVPDKHEEGRAADGREEDRVPAKHDRPQPSSISELAYRIYDERGRQDGHALEDWIEAARRISEADAKKTSPSPPRGVRLGRVTKRTRGPSDHRPGEAR